MNLEAFRRSDLLQEKKQVLSLQTVCISCIVEHLDEYSTEHLSLLPTKFRRQLLTCLPPLDILKLEGTPVVSGLDMNEVWHVIAEHYAEAADTRVDATVLPKTFKSLEMPEKGLASANFYKTIKNDWRSIFLTRTLYIMVHTFKHSSKVAHSSNCEYEDSDAECLCWGLGMDPLHHDLFWRLIALPLRSELAHYYSLLHSSQTSNFVAVEYYQKHHWHGHSPFQPRLLVPNRHAGYLADSSKNIILELSTILLKESHFRPKVMTFNCGFLHHSEFYQHLVEDSNKSQSLTDSLFSDLLSEVECLELYWPGMVEEVYEEDYGLKSEFDLDASLRTITTVLGAIFKNPSPKLTSLCVSTSRFPTLRECLPSIAPFFSAHHYTEISKNRVLPIDKAYASLKNVHILAVEMDCLQDISSIILHQSSVEGIELNFMYSSCNSDLLLTSIQNVISQRQLQFFVCQGSWYHKWFESTFQQFLSNNHDFEIFASVNGQEVVIPASSSLESVSVGKMFIINKMDFSVKLGSIFSWLRTAQVTEPLRLVRSHEGIDSCHQDALKRFVSTCKALVWSGWNYTHSILPAFFNKTKCPNLQTVTFSEFYSTVLLDLLPALFASSPQLKKLTLSKLQHSEPLGQEKVFECLMSCPYPEQLTVDLQSEFMTPEDVLKLLQVWRKKGQGRKLKAILLGHDVQPMVAEMMTLN